MIQKIIDLIRIAESPDTIVVWGDDVLQNTFVKNVGSKTVFVVSFPTGSHGDDIGEEERVTVTVKVMKKSHLNNSYADELNLLNDCDKIADKFLRAMRCQMRVVEYTKRVELMSGDTPISGIVVTFTI